MIRFSLILVLVIHGALSAAIVEEQVQHAGATFRVVRVEPSKVQVVWKDHKGVPFRSFDRVQAAFASEKKSVAFIMNAGIFEPNGIPSGLHIERGNTLHNLNLADAAGNFFLKPNGVVWIESKNQQPNARIATSTAFSQREQSFRADATTIDLAVQSGPMLLIDGARHPAFHENSSSKLHRNGVGIDGDGKLVFAITAPGQLVNFWDFAGLFLKLGCKNALFLDGDISQMAVNPSTPVRSNLFGAMFVVVE